MLIIKMRREERDGDVRREGEEKKGGERGGERRKRDIPGFFQSTMLTCTAGILLVYTYLFTGCIVN